MRKIVTSLVLVYLVLPAGPLLAQTATGTKGTIRDRLEEQRQERRDQFQEKQQEVRQRLAEHRKKNILRFSDRMLKRFAAALERQARLADRIESRLDKFAERGKDVSSQRVKLAEARALIQEGRNMVSALRQKFEGLVNSDDPKATFEEVRKVVKEELMAKIKKIHQLLVEIITSLKGASGGSAATSTPATSIP